MFIFTSDNGGMWKATSNAPLRANKGSNYEGGLRVPVIIKWPGAAAPGSISDEIVTSSDFYPTILAATGLPLNPDQHMDGVDLTPVLKGAGPLSRDAIYWHYPHYSNQGGIPGGEVGRNVLARDAARQGRHEGVLPGERRGGIGAFPDVICGALLVWSPIQSLSVQTLRSSAPGGGIPRRKVCDASASADVGGRSARRRRPRPS